MIIGPEFAVGHIPKTGGDALHQWCAALRDPLLTVDHTAGPEKHAPFSARPEVAGKRHYVLAIRPLPEWTLSYLHEIITHPGLAELCGLTPERVIAPESGLVRGYADGYLEEITAGVTITHWLRCGPCLLADLERTLEAIHRPLTRGELRTLRRTRVKPPRGYPQRAAAFWTPAQTQELYRLNPRWAEVERIVFGELQCGC